LTHGYTNFNDFAENRLTTVLSYNILIYMTTFVRVYCVQLQIVRHWHPVKVSRCHPIVATTIFVIVVVAIDANQREPTCWLNTMSTVLLTKCQICRRLICSHHHSVSRVWQCGEWSIFTALHGMQTRSSDENSVRLSVKRVISDKTKESCARFLIPHERPVSLVLW